MVRQRRPGGNSQLWIDENELGTDRSADFQDGKLRRQRSKSGPRRGERLG
jgi:hypothetical protein